jgi:hypothetical protein
LPGFKRFQSLFRAFTDVFGGMKIAWVGKVRPLQPGRFFAMSNALTTAAATVLRQTADAAPRLGGAGGLGSPGAVAGQFAAMLASLRDGGADGAAETATTGVSQPFGSVAGSDKSAVGEHKVSLSAVSLLWQDMEQPEAPSPTTVDYESEPAPRPRIEAPADVSMEVVATSIASGAPTDGRWMATLMATGQVQGMESAAA